MPGMYPDNQTLEVFGKTIEYPGVDKSGKFTNGSFSDPEDRPSFIPAETINLILDNLTAFLVFLGKTPNNHDANQLALAIKDALATKQPQVIEATCATAAATAAKVVTINNYNLTKGDIIAITYTNGNTANSATININDAGAKAVSLGAGAPTAESNTGAHYIAANRTALYFYNGTYFCLFGNQDITDNDTPLADKSITLAKIQDIAADTTSTKASFSTTAITFLTFLQTIWRGITWLNGKLNASSGHKHTGGTDDAPRIDYNSLNFPVGKLIIQLPSEPNPDGVYPGTWEKWNTRPIIYGLVDYSPSYSNYSDSVSSISAGANRLVTHADGDKVIYTSKQTITPAAGSSTVGEFNPTYWNLLSGMIFVARNNLPNHSWGSDLSINSSLTYNGATYRVVAIHSLAGKFLSVAGGNRPPFESGGVYGDISRLLSGHFAGELTSGSVDGKLFYTDNTAISGNTASVSGYTDLKISFDSSRVVPTGNENSPRTLSVNYWRRVS